MDSFESSSGSKWAEWERREGRKGRVDEKRELTFPSSFDSRRTTRSSNEITQHLWSRPSMFRLYPRSCRRGTSERCLNPRFVSLSAFLSSLDFSPSPLDLFSQSLLRLHLPLLVELTLPPLPSCFSSLLAVHASRRPRHHRERLRRIRRRRSRLLHLWFD